MERKVNRFIKLYPWYAGITGDLLFYIAIDTLFLTIVKNFSAAQVVALSSLSQFACIALQFPLLFLIKRIGNTHSARSGAFCLLASALLITFGKNFYLVLLGRVLHDVALILREASTVMLENNLDLVDKRSDFVRLRTSANTIYAVITMLISFVASLMFNLNNYLPMFGCITTCSIGFLLSLFMKDYSDYDKIAAVPTKREKVKIHYGKFLILALVVFSIFYPVIATGQTEGKLFIQENLLADFNTDNTALVLGGIVCVSRIVRVFSNILFAKLYEKYQKAMIIALPVMLCTAIASLLFGSFIPLVFLRIAVMSFGYIIILFARDPYKLCIQDAIFEKTPKEQHQTLLTIMQFGVKIGTAAMGLSFSALLLQYPMALVMSIIFVIAAIEIFLSIWLYRVTARQAAPAV